MHRARAELVVQGEITGKNETERDARMRSLLREEIAAVELAELEERRAGIAVELARVEIERIQTVIKYLSVLPGRRDAGE